MYVLAVALLHTRKLRAIIPAAAQALLLTSLDVVRNWITLGNPVLPFLNSWFPNPHVQVAFETMIREMMRHYPGLPAMSSQELTEEYLGAQDCVLIATDHSAYDYEYIVEHSRLVLDTRNATKNVKKNREKIRKA